MRELQKWERKKQVSHLMKEEIQDDEGGKG